ncbi:hypothetical protein DEO72_LG7g2710 [Vigna unguiculata]|uniref:Uncharacterized protein n=1 Tax=Vigna unguiculata TaxID=3917 RepID=A0A4D6MJ38_VIGUN|nr:hypothetical protein DEO72_LG7g2710 [Vigna unguiculata]
MKVVTIFSQEIDDATREQDEQDALDALLQISQTNMVSEEPESLIKQLKEMNFDLYHSTDGDMVNGIHLNVATGGSVAIPQSLYTGECSNTKMDIIGSSQTYGSPKDNLSGKSHAPAIFDEEEEEAPTQDFGGTGATPLSLNNNIPEMLCGTNRNPADFTLIEAKNPYMRDREDEVRKKARRGQSCDSSSRRTRSKRSPS